MIKALIIILSLVVQNYSSYICGGVNLGEIAVDDEWYGRKLRGGN